MKPTRVRLLVALVVVSAAVGWGLATLVDAYADRSLPVPWTAAVVMFVLALSLGLWARGTRARLAHAPGTKPMDALVAARSAALAMAASRTGAIVAGFYAGVALSFAPDWALESARARIVVAVVTVLGALLLVLAALWLERVCRVPPGTGDDETP